MVKRNARDTIVGLDIGTSKVVAIVGDVVGHGAEQIAVMGQLRAASNALARLLPGPAAVLDGLDRFARDLPGALSSSVVVLFLDGTTIDFYEDVLYKRGFTFDNPNAVKTCVCGSSFQS